MKELCQLRQQMALVSNLLGKFPQAGPWGLRKQRAGMQVGAPQSSGDLLQPILILGHFFSREKVTF